MPHTIQQDLDLWEIWVEYDQFHPEYFGTLYVHGEVAADKKTVVHFKKRDSGCEGQLILQLPERSSSIDHTNEVLYSEPVRNLNQYTSVCIYAGNELIGCFHDIEIMI
jgi:hypothetical protein